MKILIVDDKQENLYLLETMLKGTGHEVVSARNGLEALEKLKGIEVDMIIADILMPEMDGFQLCKTVKSDDIFGRIPFVFYTASYTEDRDEELAYKVGADKYIRKPVEPDVFIKIIQGILEDSREQRLTPHKPAAENEEAILKLYNERLVAKLQQKRIALEQEIEERKKTEANLRKSEEQHKKLFEEIQERVKDLENFYQMAIGRELRMKELKEEIADLKEKLEQCTGGKSREEDE
jgi:CheY-like chemotaxis protein